MPGSEFVFRADDGVRLLGRRWLPDGRPARSCRSRTASPSTAPATRGSPARSTRPATGSTPATCAAMGPPRAPADLGHFADADGWAKCVGDLWTFNRLIAAEQPGVPIVFLGHSTGLVDRPAVRLRTQRGARRRRLFRLERQAAAARRARPARSPAPNGCGRASAARAGSSIRCVRRLQQALRARAHQVRLALARSGGSRRLCRRSALRLRVTNQLAIDFLDACPASSRPSASRRIRKDLPIYVFSGERDPVGANIQGLIDALKAAGFTQAHDPHLSGRPARDAERDQPRRGYAGPDRLARRGRGTVERDEL